MATATPKRKLNLLNLAAEAREAREQGELERARAAYEHLEKRDPSDPAWPRQLANLYRQSGRSKDELDALVRCADRQSAQDEFRSAISTYEMILSIDPDHRLAQERLSGLQPNSAVSVRYIDDHPSDGDAPGSDSVRAPRLAASASRDPKLSPPIDVLVLSNLVTGAHPATLAEESRAGLREIPLDEPEAGPPAPLDTTAASAALRDEGFDTRQQRAALRRLPLFRSLDDPAIAELAEQARWLQPGAGEELVHQGDKPGGLYVVIQGAVVPIAEGETRTRLAVLEAGDFFGEIALFSQRPRSATVEALVDSHVLYLDRGATWSLLQNNAGLLLRVLQALRERVVHGLVQTSPLFQIFSNTKLSAIARRFRLLEAEEGCALIEQDGPCEAIFMLLAGHVDIVRRHETDGPSGRAPCEKLLTNLEPGELFGEMSLLWHEPSQASLIARGRCWLLALPARSFQEMLDHHPELAVQASRIAQTRRDHLLLLSGLPPESVTRSD